MKSLQFFKKEYLEHCKKLKPEDIISFLEGFRELHFYKKQTFNTTELKVQINPLKAFKMKSKLNRIP